MWGRGKRKGGGTASGVGEGECGRQCVPSSWGGPHPVSVQGNKGGKGRVNGARESV